MGRKSPFDSAEFCDFNGEYSGASATGHGWIDALAEKGIARDAGEDLTESVQGYGWLVGRMASGESEMRF